MSRPCVLFQIPCMDVGVGIVGTGSPPPPSSPSPPPVIVLLFVGGMERKMTTILFISVGWWWWWWLLWCDSHYHKCPSKNGFHRLSLSSYHPHSLFTSYPPSFLILIIAPFIVDGGDQWSPGVAFLIPELCVVGWGGVRWIITLTVKTQVQYMTRFS